MSQTIDRATVVQFARNAALHDLAITLSMGKDPEGLEWGPDHTVALAKHVGSPVGALIDAVGEDVWYDLISAAQDAYARWMRRRADESRELRADLLADGWTVVDASGQRWWPTEEEQERIAAAHNPAYAVLRGCIGDEMQGEWRS